MDEDIVKTSDINPDVIPNKEKLCYGIGALMDGGSVALMSCVLLRYMTDGMAMEAEIASTIIMASKIWDGVSDPLMGAISDNTRSKYGRRKPYLFVGGILIVLALALLFAPIRSIGIQGGGITVYMLITYLIYNTISTVTQVPYCSLASDISPDFNQRNAANTVKLVFSAGAGGLAYMIPLFVLEKFTDGIMPHAQFWLFIVIVFGTLFGGGLIICSLVVKERITVDENTPKVKFSFKSYALPLQIKTFKWHLLMYASAFMCMDIISALAVYYATDVWGGATLFGMNFSSLFVIGPLMVMAVVAFPMVSYAMKKRNKQFAFRMGLPFYIASGIMLAVMSPSWAPPILVPIVAALMGLGFGGAQMMPWIIFPDTVDVAEMKLGYRPTGNFSGVMTLIRKLAGAFGVGLIGYVLSWSGYISSTADEVVIQSDGTLLAIRLTLGISIAVLISVALFASFQFKLTNKKLTRVRYFIEAVKERGVDGLTEEESAERQALIDELA